MIVIVRESKGFVSVGRRYVAGWNTPEIDYSQYLTRAPLAGFRGKGQGEYMLTSFSALLAASSVVAPPCTTGTWALQASGQTIFRIEISTTTKGATATWERPEHFSTDGENFSRVSGPTVRRLARSVTVVNGDVELSFDDPAPGAIPDVFRLRCVDSGHLSATYQGMGYEPFDLTRTQAQGVPLGPWHAERSYVRVITRPTNAEMTAIFDADQADRRAKHIDWSIVSAADKKRQIRTEELLRSGALQSGDDFYHAAFVFQHGSVADDYLKGHLLAMIAAARGKPGAVWIASTTLDRYLQAIGRPQVLGTQFRIPKGAPATQEPYDRDLVSDAMRKALRVPTMSEQEQHRQKYTAGGSGPQKP